MLHFLDGEEEPFFFFRKNRFNMKERIMRPIKSGLGLVTTLFLALAFEVAENSPIVIAFFRKNSGKVFRQPEKNPWLHIIFFIIYNRNFGRVQR